MTPRDVGLALLICLIWAGNQVMSRLVLADLGAPPIFYALARSLVIVAVLFPLLRPLPKNLPQIALVGILLGGGGFALNFLGLRYASPSTCTFVLQLSVPMASALSVLVLGERLGPARLSGIALAFGGILLLLWDPQTMSMSHGLIFSAASAFCSALGAVLLKKVAFLHPLRLQVWGGFSSIPLLVVLSFSLEPAPLASAIQAGWPFLAAIGASALIVSVFSHTAYYHLLQTYEASQIVPLMLMQTLMTVGLGVLITGDQVSLKMALGGVVTLAGVFLIIRSNWLTAKG
jgi:O-acetylserine/cysteine efflux transporter